MEYTDAVEIKEIKENIGNGITCTTIIGYDRITICVRDEDDKEINYISLFNDKKYW